MCIMVYTASERVLPHWDWEFQSRYVSVRGPLDDVSALSRIFSHPHIYTVSAVQTGDGCGFQYGTRESKRAREELALFLECVLAHVPEVELFVQHFGSELSDAQPSSYDQIGPSDIRTWRSCFRHDEFLIVAREE